MGGGTGVKTKKKKKIRKFVMRLTSFCLFNTLLDIIMFCVCVLFFLGGGWGGWGGVVLLLRVRMGGGCRGWGGRRLAGENEEIFPENSLSVFGLILPS